MKRVMQTERVALNFSLSGQKDDDPGEKSSDQNPRNGYGKHRAEQTGQNKRGSSTFNDLDAFLNKDESSSRTLLPCNREALPWTQ